MMTRALAATCKTLLCGATIFLATGCGGDDERVAAPTPPDSPADEVETVLLGAPSGLNSRAAGGTDVLRWAPPTAETTQTLAGYNVYAYSPSPDTPDAYVRVNSTVVTGGRYVFDDLMPGAEYHIKVRAVDSDGNESGWSTTHSFRAQQSSSGSDGRPGGLGESDPDEVEHDGGPVH